MANKNHNLSREASLDYYSKERERRERRGIGIKVAALAVAALCIVGVALGVVAANIGGVSTDTSNAAEPAASGEQTVTTVKESVSKKPFYLLLLGSVDDGTQTDATTDETEEGTEDEEATEEATSQTTYRADPLLLCRIDPDGTKATIVSVPSDLLVDTTTEESGQRTTAKLGSAYTPDDPSAKAKQVGTLCGKTVDHYVHIDLKSLFDMADDGNGIEVTLPYAVGSADGTGLQLQAGTQTLSADEALELCHDSQGYDYYNNGSASRAANQRAIIKAAFKKALASDPDALADALATLSKSMTTDLTQEQVLAIAAHMLDVDSKNGLYEDTAPTLAHVPVVANDVYYEELEEEAWDAMMQRVDAGESPSETTEDGTATDDAQTTEEGTEDEATTDEDAEKDENAEDEDTKKDETTEDEDGSQTDTSSSSSASQSNPFLSITAMDDVDKSGVVVILGMNDGRPSQYATELTDMGFNATAYEASIYPFDANSVVYSDPAYEEEATAIAAYLGSDYTVMLNDGSIYMPPGSNVYVRVKAE